MIAKLSSCCRSVLDGKQERRGEGDKEASEPFAI